MDAEPKPESTSESDEIWTELLDAVARVSVVVGDEYADDQDYERATSVAIARGVAACADALRSLRQELARAVERLAPPKG
jgi:hypothetical protein